jgi:hypothetical protein
VLKAARGLGPLGGALLGAYLHALGSPTIEVRKAAFEGIRALGLDGQQALAAVYMQSVREADQKFSGTLREYVQGAGRELLLKFEKFDKLMMKLGTEEQIEALGTLRGAVPSPELFDFLSIAIGLGQAQKTRMRASDQLAQFASSAVGYPAERCLVLSQYLLAITEQGGSVVKSKLIEALGMIAAGKSTPPHIRHAAPAVIAEMQQAEGADERAWLAYMAYNLDPVLVREVLPVIFDAMRDRDPSARAQSIDCLGEMARTLRDLDAREASRRLSRALLDDHQIVRLAAVDALGNLTDESAYALTVLGTFLCDGDRALEERQAVCDALTNIRLHLPAEQCGRVVTLLAYVMNDGEAELAAKAAETLRHYGPYLRDGLSLFRRCLEKESADNAKVLVELFQDTIAESHFTPDERIDLATTLMTARERFGSLAGKKNAGLLKAIQVLAEKLAPNQ